MWFPPSSSSSQQQHSGLEYSRQQQKTYSTTSYYCNGDELSTICLVRINDENESSVHCQPTFVGNVHVPFSEYNVTRSTNFYGNEMSSYQRTTRKSYYNPVIVAPTKISGTTNDMTKIETSSSSLKSCWDWLLFSPEYYSDFYSPSTYIHQQQRFDENDDNNIQLDFISCLPTCLLPLLYLTPKLVRSTDDENDSDQEINSLRRNDEPSLTISSNLSLSSNIKNSNLNLNDDQKRSSTPDTDDGYQSASDASRSDYSHQSLVNYDHHQSQNDLTTTENCLPTPLMPRRITYAAAVKPITTETIRKISPTSTVGPNDMLNLNNQKLKFIAPRFERMHHAKQYSSSTSNRTQTRPINNNNNNINHHHPRNRIVNSTRRR